MVVAESRGLLRPLRAGDALGRVRENAIFRQLQRETKAKAAELRFLRESAASQYLMGDSEMKVFKHHRDLSYKEYLRWLSHSQPYEDWETRIEEIEREELLKDIKLWEDEWGNLDDPEVQAETERLADWLRYGDGGVDDEFQEM